MRLSGTTTALTNIKLQKSDKCDNTLHCSVAASRNEALSRAILTDLKSVRDTQTDKTIISCDIITQYFINANQF